MKASSIASKEIIAAKGKRENIHRAQEEQRPDQKGENLPSLPEKRKSLQPAGYLKCHPQKNRDLLPLGDKRETLKAESRKSFIKKKPPSQANENQMLSIQKRSSAGGRFTKRTSRKIQKQRGNRTLDLCEPIDRKENALVARNGKGEKRLPAQRRKRTLEEKDPHGSF